MLFTLLVACQAIGPIFVNYNGVRGDIATWINQQNFLSMQQKRSLAQLSRAQQKLVRIDNIAAQDKVDIATQNQIAMYCAKRHLSQKKIVQLQDLVFALVDQQYISQIYTSTFPQIKLDPQTIHCD